MRKTYGETPDQQDLTIEHCVFCVVDSHSVNQCMKCPVMVKWISMKCSVMVKWIFLVLSEPQASGQAGLVRSGDSPSATVNSWLVTPGPSFCDSIGGDLEIALGEPVRERW